ncbi:MAG TPA: DUF3866 family protein [Dermatophilaceae bacterium]|nr:DUF3866 family protein [Dermatophilaceae bacterium]
MMQWREGMVEAETGRWPGAVEYAVQLAPTADLTSPPASCRALAYTALVGEPRPGDRVLLNASALLRGLGTGGLAFVVAMPDRLPPDTAARPGHIVKARYTPQQQMLLAVDEQESPHHEALREADDLAAMPVVAADLHSALPAIVAGLRADSPDVRVAYVMTDGGALPAAFSRTVAGLRSAGWLAATLTVGQSFGGDHEAVSVHTGLLAARLVVGADVAVVVQGPGNVGTGTRWGFSGVGAGEALNAAHTLHGRPVAALRVSEGDQRARHRGVSHHSLTAYGRVFLGQADLPVPALPGPLGRLVADQARDLRDSARGTLNLVEVATEGLDEALAGCPVPLSTMGRGLEQDRAAFVAAAAAGRHAAHLLLNP